MATILAIFCFGIASICAVIYGKLPSDHPAESIPFIGFVGFFLMGAHL
jgi:hypothetical protein